MTCEHPKECLDEYDECLWCNEVRNLTHAVTGLTACLTKRAVIVNEGGTATIEGDVGYLALHGGSVTLNAAGAGYGWADTVSAKSES
jgi:hypothetical protein